MSYKWYFVVYLQYFFLKEEEVPSRNGPPILLTVVYVELSIVMPCSLCSFHNFFLSFSISCSTRVAANTKSVR